MPYVDDCDPTCGLQHSNDLTNSLFPFTTIRNVVERKARQDDVEGFIREVELARITVANFDTISNPFEPGVLGGLLGPVVRLVGLAPNVDADRATGGESFRHGHEKQPMATADV